MEQLIDRLYQTQNLTKEEWVTLLSHRSPQTDAYLFEKARKVRYKHYKNDVYIRGLIEISNYCKNDCYYCGIRKSNGEVCRYRLSDEEILDSCQSGHELGFRTFVLQGGEDGAFSDERLTSLIKTIKEKYPENAITLSLGERSKESYQRLFNAGADRYLLRHETWNEAHYQKLHPPGLFAENRKACLENLKEIGFQTGSGFMVGSPFQTLENLAEDMLYLKELNPEMVGIGPFIAQHQTPFGGYADGDVELTLFLVGALRLMLPRVLLPSTTALHTIGKMGRQRGILAGANVVMPNLSPIKAKENYTLYDKKLYSGEESATALEQLKHQMESIGYEVVTARGDFNKACEKNEVKQ